MMSAKYQIVIPQVTGVTATTINIPVNLEPQMVDQCELINRKFVDVEVENSINPILDYEKARFTPSYTGVTNGIEVLLSLDSVTYNPRFLSSGGFPTALSFYSDIDMSDDDIKFGKKRFENSFLNLSFYDSDRATDQRLISIINVFPRITSVDLQGVNDPSPGQPRSASAIPVTFKLEDPIRKPAGFAEGFFIYNFKDEITVELPKALYMRARFNNASNGETTNMMTEGQAFTIDDLVNKLYTKYILQRDNTGYFYVVDEIYSNNVIRSGANLTVNLYEIQAL